MFSLAWGMPVVSPLQMTDRHRIIIALPDATESATVAEWLAATRFEAVQRPDPGTAALEMQARAFDLLVADATFAVRDDLLALSRLRNPSTPTVVIGNADETELPWTLRRQAMYLGRPLERAIVLCTLSMAILESRPTRRSERKMANRFDAIVNGVPSQIIDASHHGVRLRIPGCVLSVLPPQFSVRVPSIGVSVTVQRVWARSGQHEATPVISCGAALSANRPAIEQRWRGFVDTLPIGDESTGK